MFNNYRKFGKFDIGSDIQNTTFSEKLDKNNWTSKIGLHGFLAVWDSPKCAHNRTHKSAHKPYIFEPEKPYISVQIVYG